MSEETVREQVHSYVLHDLSATDFTAAQVDKGLPHLNKNTVRSELSRMRVTKVLRYNEDRGLFHVERPVPQVSTSIDLVKAVGRDLRSLRKVKPVSVRILKFFGLVVDRYNSVDTIMKACGIAESNKSGATRVRNLLDDFASAGIGRVHRNRKREVVGFTKPDVWAYDVGDARAAYAAYAHVAYADAPGELVLTELQGPPRPSRVKDAEVPVEETVPANSIPIEETVAARGKVGTRAATKNELYEDLVRNLGLVFPVSDEALSGGGALDGMHARAKADGYRLEIRYHKTDLKREHKLAVLYRRGA